MPALVNIMRVPPEMNHSPYSEEELATYCLLSVLREERVYYLKYSNFIRVVGSRIFTAVYPQAFLKAGRAQ